jgi:uncharacterized protein YukE
MSDDLILYDNAVITGCAGGIRTFLGAMNSHLSDVNAQLTSKMATWDSSGKEAYVLQKHVWDTAASNINTRLGALAAQMENSAFDMAACDKRVADCFTP